MYANLGNVDPINSEISPTVTSVTFPDDWDADEAFTAIVGANEKGGLWEAHSKSKPSWIESDNDKLAEKVSAHYGCPIGSVEATL